MSEKGRAFCGSAATRPSAPPGERRRYPAAERRQQILATAIDLFVSEGIDAVSLRRIAAKLAITPAAIYSHFDNKDAILHGLVADFFASLMTSMAELGPGGSAREQFKKLSRAYIANGLRLPNQYRLVFMTPLSRPGKGHRAVKLPGGEMSDGLGVSAFAVLEAAVAELQGGRRDDTPLVADAAWAALHGAVSMLITLPDFPWADADHLADTVVDLIIAGIETAEARPGGRGPAR